MSFFVRASCLFAIIIGAFPGTSQARSTTSTENVWFNAQGECAHTEIAYHISRVAVSPAGLNQAKSIERAQEQARQKLQEQFCTNLSTRNCAKLSRNISVVEYAIHPSKKQICALARMPAQLATDPTGRIAAEKELAESLSRIIERAQQLAPEQPVHFRAAVRSDTQCVAGLTGDALIAQLKELAIQKRLTVVEQASTALIIETKIIPEQKTWTVAVSGYSSAISKQALGSFSLPKHRIDPSSLQDACIPSEDDRLKRGYASHSSGLTLEISLGQEKTSWCEGDKVPLQISASQPAHIRVFSVASSPKQQSIMVYPHPVRKGHPVDPYAARTHFDLGTMELFPTSSTPKQETIMVLAVPEGADFHSLEKLKKPCITDEPIEQWLPRDVALEIFNYTIYPIGSQAGALQCNLENLSFEAREQSTEGWLQWLSGLSECPIE